MIVILLGEGFEEIEAIAPYALLKRAGSDVRFAGVGGTEITGSHGVCVTAELSAEALCADDIEMIVLPGGLRGVQSLSESAAAMSLTKRVWENGGYVAAICAAPTLLAGLGISDGKALTCYPGMEDRMGKAKMKKQAVVKDGRLITGRAAGSAVEFGLALVGAMKGQTTADKIASGIVCG